MSFIPDLEKKFEPSDFEGTLIPTALTTSTTTKPFWESVRLGSTPPADVVQAPLLPVETDLPLSLPACIMQLSRAGSASSKISLAIKGGSRVVTIAPGVGLYDHVDVSLFIPTDDHYYPRDSSGEVHVRGQAYQSKRTMFFHTKIALSDPDGRQHSMLTTFSFMPDEALGLNGMIITHLIFPAHGVEHHLNDDGSASLDHFRTLIPDHRGRLQCSSIFRTGDGGP